MLRYTLMFAAALAIVSPARANTWADNLFEEHSRDFGSVPHGPMLVHQFRLVNNTKSTIHIANVRVSCHCTAAEALQYTLAPGQETAIKAQMDSGRFYGVRAVTIYVTFDQPQFEEVRLVVQANSRPDIFFAPDYLAFGKVKHGKTATAQMTVSFSGQPQIQIIAAHGESNYIQPKVQELRRDQGEVIYQISATVHKDTPEGKWFTDIWLTTNSTATPRLRVPLTVEVEPAPAAPAAPTTPPATNPTKGNPTAIAAAPAQTPTAPPAAAPQTPPAPVAPATAASTPAPAKAAATSTPTPNIPMGQVKVGMEIERKVILKGTQPFRITSIEGTDSELQVRVANSESLTVHVLTVTLRPTQPGQMSRTIRVQTDLQNNHDIEFNTQALIIP